MSRQLQSKLGGSIESLQLIQSIECLVKSHCFLQLRVSLGQVCWQASRQVHRVTMCSEDHVLRYVSLDRMLA